MLGQVSTRRQGRRVWSVGVVRLVLTVATISLVAGCGSDSASEDSTGVGEEFGRQALEVCQTALEAKRGWQPFPVPDFDPTEPDPSKFPEVSSWLVEEVTPTFVAWADGLNGLGSPPSGQEAWDEVVNAVEKIVQLNADQVAAAKGGDAIAFAAATGSLRATQHELVAATEAAGVSECADVHA